MQALPPQAPALSVFPPQLLMNCGMQHLAQDQEYSLDSCFNFYLQG